MFEHLLHTNMRYSLSILMFKWKCNGWTYVTHKNMISKCVCTFLGVREYITMEIYWIISLDFREILFCEYKIFENDLTF